MRRPLLLLPLALLASPASALSVSSAACNGQAAELVTDGAGTRFTVNGEAVSLPLDGGVRYDDLLCVSRDGQTLFGLTQYSVEDDMSYYLVDPGTGELTNISSEEAEALDFWETEDDWFADEE